MRGEGKYAPKSDIRRLRHDGGADIGIKSVYDWPKPGKRSALFKSLFKILPVMTVVLVVAACAAPIPGAEFNDPFEARNRRVHEFNKQVDSALLGPAGRSSARLPDEITVPLGHMADNTALPGMVLNGVLQGDIEGAVTNTVRFLLNSTIGIGGLFDPAGAIGLNEMSTDFGETLAVWGVPEGAYLEVPFRGPSTQRDAFGGLVDMFLDPLGHYASDAEMRIIAGVRVAGIVIDRGQFGGMVDSVLYDSADSYAQARLIYLQNRRFELGQGPGGSGGAAAGDGTYIDPYSADPYADPYLDPYLDPYEATQ